MADYSPPTSSSRRMRHRIDCFVPGGVIDAFDVGKVVVGVLVETRVWCEGDSNRSIDEIDYDDCYDLTVMTMTKRQTTTNL